MPDFPIMGYAPTSSLTPAVPADVVGTTIKGLRVLNGDAVAHDVMVELVPRSRRVPRIPLAPFPLTLGPGCSLVMTDPINLGTHALHIYADLADVVSYVINA
jgi:hypothetical protein